MSGPAAVLPAPRYDRRPTISTMLWWVGIAAIVVANAVVVAPAFTTVRLWEDEAFNLTVPLNLLRGLGYASDGTLSGSEITPFDVRISTGPVLLLPVTVLIGLGIDPVVAGRLIGLAGYSLLLGGLFTVGRRLGGRWAGLIAAALPLAYAADTPPSPIQTPVDLLGEVTAAGLLVAALLVLHRRPWLAGLFIGLAVQTKFIALLVLPAFAVAAFLDAPGPLRGRVRQTLPGVLAAAACAAAPTVVFEAVKLVTLGWAGYVDNLRQFSWFLRSGGQTGYAIPPQEKFAALLGAWHVPWWFVAVVAVAGIGVAVVGAVAVRADPGRLQERGGTRVAPREFATITLAALIALGTFLVWWPFSAHTPVWLRHPAPAVLAFVPVLVAASIALARVALVRREQTEGEAKGRARLLASLLAVGGIALLAISIVGRVAAPAYAHHETLTAQRAAAHEVARLGDARLASPWGAEVSIVVMSGAHSGLVDAGAAVANDRQLWHQSRLPEWCGSPIPAGAYRLCEPPE